MSAPATHRKGYPTTIFRDITVPIAKYLCVLCGLILNIPVQRFCGHRYCKNCVDEAIAALDGSDLQCPACADDGVDEEPLDSSVRQVILRLELLGLHGHGVNPSCLYNLQIVIWPSDGFVVCVCNNVSFNFVITRKR